MSRITAVEKFKIVRAITDRFCEIMDEEGNACNETCQCWKTCGCPDTESLRDTILETLEEVLE